MKLGRRTALAGLIATPALARAQDAPLSLRELARRAAIYLFPVYEMYRARWQATVNEANPARQRLNRFRHVTTLADPRTRAVSMPSGDTLQSFAWLDLSNEPMFLVVPPVGDLYYSYAFLDLFTDTFATGQATSLWFGHRPIRSGCAAGCWSATPASWTGSLSCRRACCSRRPTCATNGASWKRGS